MVAVTAGALAAGLAAGAVRAERNITPSPAPPPPWEARLQVPPKLPLTMGYLSPERVRLHGALAERLVEPALRRLTAGPDPAPADVSPWLRAASRLALYSGSPQLRARVGRVAAAAASPSALPGLLDCYLYLGNDSALETARRIGPEPGDLESVVLLHRATGEAGYLQAARAGVEGQSRPGGWIAHVLARDPSGEAAPLLRRANALVEFARLVGDTALLDPARMVWSELHGAPPSSGEGAWEWLRLNAALLALGNDQRYADEIGRALRLAEKGDDRSLAAAAIAALAPSLVQARCNYLGGDGLALIYETGCTTRVPFADGEVELFEAVRGGTADLRVASLKPPPPGTPNAGKPWPQFGLRVRATAGCGPTQVTVSRLMGDQPGDHLIPPGEWGILFGLRAWTVGDTAALVFDTRQDDRPRATASKTELLAALQSARVEPVAVVPGHLEGPAWREGYGLLFCSDSEGHVMHLVDENVRVRPQRFLNLGASGILRRLDGHYIATDNREHRIIDLAPDGKVHVLADSWNGQKLRLTNDITMDRDGTVYWTDPDDCTDGKAGGWIMALTPNGKVERVGQGYAYPNGIEVDPTNRYLYVVQSGARNVLRFPLPKPGAALGKGSVFCTLQDNAIGDGLACDAMGNVYIASFSGGRIEVWDPAGKRLGAIELPGYHPTNVTFGGPNLDELYITADGVGDVPSAILHVKLGIPGFPGWRGAPLNPLRTLPDRAEPLPPN